MSVCLKIDDIRISLGSVLSDYLVLCSALLCPDVDCSEPVSYDEFCESCAFMFAGLREKLTSVYTALQSLCDELSEQSDEPPDVEYINSAD